MQKKALKIGYGMIPQKREWLASLCTLEKKGVNAGFLSGWIFSGRDEKFLFSLNDNSMKK